MKLNSPESIETAKKVFRSYDGSWTAAREAGHRDENGVLVIPVKKRPGADNDDGGRLGAVRRAG